MDELLPIFEREGLQLIIEPHPDDFIEDGLEAMNLIRGLNKDWLGFLYCTPHAFHQGHDPATIIEAAGEKVRYVHLADAWNHLTSNGLRYITNPRLAIPPACISTWRWAWARLTTTRFSLRLRPLSLTG
jgi:myo-inositol catabolism protein IolH